MTYSTTWAFSLFQEEKATSADKASYVKNIFNIALRETPWFDGKKTHLVMRGVGWEVIWEGKIIDWITWLPVRYTENISGWVHSKLVAKEDYYAMASDHYTVFLRERTSLAGTSQDICTTNTAVSATNVLTSFRPEIPVYSYTPSDTTITDTGSTSSYQQNVLTSFRPEVPVYSYTPSGSVTTETWVVTETQQNVLTSFRPEVPIFKYIVDTAVNNIDSSIVQTVASMILTSFRPEIPVYSYTPSGSVTTETWVVTETQQNILTSFRPEIPVYSYTPSGSVTTETWVVTETQQNILTSFRPEVPVYSYTPEVTYTCQSVN
jgi:hypothetical protein